MNEHGRNRIHQSAAHAQEAALRLAWELEYRTRMEADEDLLKDLADRVEKAKTQAVINAKKVKMKPRQLREIREAVLSDMLAKQEGEQQWERSQLAVKRAAKLKDSERPAIPDELPDGSVQFVTIQDHLENIEAYDVGLQLTREWLGKLQPKEQSSQNGQHPKTKPKRAKVKAR